MPRKKKPVLIPVTDTQQQAHLDHVAFMAERIQDLQDSAELADQLHEGLEKSYDDLDKQWSEKYDKQKKYYQQRVKSIQDGISRTHDYWEAQLKVSRTRYLLAGFLLGCLVTVASYLLGYYV